MSDPAIEASTLALAFAASARRHRNRLAVRDSGRDVSYAELDTLRRDAARGLIALGIAAGDRVAIWGVNSLNWIIAGLAIQSIGATLVPIGTRLRGREAGAILRSAKVRLLFCDHGFGSYGYVAAIGQEDVPTLDRVVVVDSDGAGDRAIGWAAMMAAGAAIEADEVDARAAAVRPDDLADILFTSGTTGTPKGVLMTHGQSLIACEHSVKAMQLTPDDVLPSVFPFAHNAGYRAAWQVALLNGLRIDPIATVDPLGMLEMVQANRATILPTVPTVYQAMMDHPARADFDLSSLRLAMTGGTTVPVDLIRQIRTRLGVPHVTTAYGMTETAGNISYCRIGDPDEVVAHSAGRPLDNLDVRVVGPDLLPLPQGQAGEIVVRGAQVTHGYLDNPAATREATTPDGYFRTGDIGLFDESGNLRITDRLKNMYITGGFNCYPAEIEQALCLLPGVSQVAVIGVEDARLGEVGRAFIVPTADSPLDEAAVIAWSRDNMAGYKVPRSVRFIDRLPLNATGKVSKEELRAMA